MSRRVRDSFGFAVVDGRSENTAPSISANSTFIANAKQKSVSTALGKENMAIRSVRRTRTDQPDVQKALALIYEVLGDRFYPIDIEPAPDQTLGIALVIERSCLCCPGKPTYRISLGGPSCYPQCPLCQPLDWNSLPRDLRPKPAATEINTSPPSDSTHCGELEGEHAKTLLVASRPLSKSVM